MQGGGCRVDKGKSTDWDKHTDAPGADAGRRGGKAKVRSDPEQLIKATAAALCTIHPHTQSPGEHRHGGGRGKETKKF